MQRWPVALDNIELSKMLETAIVAARLAGQRAMEEIHYTKTTVKSPDQLVTETDIRCQQLIIDRIKQTYPDHGFIAEEGPDGRLFKQAPRGDRRIWWAIDPIDGTTNFAHQVPIFGVSVGALFEGEPIVGVIFEPATDAMYTAVKGGEAQLNGRRITVSDEDLSQFAGLALDSHLDFDGKVPDWVDQIIKQCRFRNFGTTAGHFGAVAKGGFVAMILNTPKLWDIAAGAAIIESAGGLITNWQGAKLFPVDCDVYDGRSFQTLAANKTVHAKLLEMLQSG